MPADIAACAYCKHPNPDLIKTLTGAAQVICPVCGTSGPLLLDAREASQGWTALMQTCVLLNPVAERKLQMLHERGYDIRGYAIGKGATSPMVPHTHGFITLHGFVGWYAPSNGIELLELP